MALARSLGLSPAQCQSLLSIRRRQRARLAELAAERKEVTMQARCSSCSKPCCGARRLQPWLSPFVQRCLCIKARKLKS